MLTFILTLYFTGKSQRALRGEGTPGYPVKLVINITKTSSPQTIRFDACQVLSCGDLNDQRPLSGDNKYLCPEWTNLNRIKRQVGPHVQGGAVFGGLPSFKGGRPLMQQKNL